MHSYKQTKMCFPHVRNFKLIYGLFSCVMYVLFGPILIENYVCFFQCLLNFWAHALQLELNKVGYTIFAKFQLQSMSSEIEREFEEKKKKNMLLSSFCQFQLKSNFFRTFYLTFFYILYLTLSLNLCDEYYFFFIN